MYKIIFYFILAVLLVSGCTKNREEQEVIKGTTVPLSLVATRAGILTKASISALPVGISTGIYVTDKDAAITAAFFGNKNYFAGTSGVLYPGAVGESVYLTVGRNYDIYSYAPYQFTLSNPNSIEFSHGTDVLWAPKHTLIGVTSTNCTAELAFEHIASQISFHVVFAGNTTITPSSTIRVDGFYDKGTLNVVNGVLTPSGSTGAYLNGVGNGPAGAMTLDIGTTCFIPPTGTMNLNVQITHEGKTYNGTITDTFLAGSSYKYTITVNGPGSPIGITGTLNDWTPVSDNVIVKN